MVKNCENCNNRIRFKAFYKQMLKDRYTYTCIECGTVHKATMSSMILNGVIFIIPFVSLIGQRKLFLVSIGWILITHLVVQPFVLQYKKL